jgi:hypothetical protein
MLTFYQWIFGRSYPTYVPETAPTTSRLWCAEAGRQV